MHVLQVAMELPFSPGGTGGSTRQFRLLRELVALGHRVTVACPVRHDHPDRERAAAAMDAAGIEFHPVWRPASRAGELRAAVRRDLGTLGALAMHPFVPWQFGVIW